MADPHDMRRADREHLRASRTNDALLLALATLAAALLVLAYAAL